MFDFLKKQPLPAGLHIEDYALIGDCETAALVGNNGSIDWLCWPTFSSPACFAALLGTRENGFWQIAPQDKILRTTRRYLPDTMIVETTFETAQGAVALIDFMPPRGELSDVVRIVRGLRGKVAMRMELVLRFDYGKTMPWVTRIGDGLRAIAGADLIVMRAPVELDNEGMKTCSDFTVKAEETVPFTMTYASSVGQDGNQPVEDPKASSAFDAFDDTVSFWTDWASKGTYRGKHREAVQRSLMTLKALTYKPSGGIVAAATMGLPEALGGPRNWDYRFCWLRDTSFTLMVLLMSGYEHEARAWRRWLLRAIAGAPTQLQMLYGICGEKELHERTANWLTGYEGSRPVLIGNAASEQFQLDVYGEVVSALTRMPAAEDDIRVSAGSVQAQIVDHLCSVWNQPDDGIWETRGGRRHFTHSKVMAWVALDRAIKHYEQFAGNGDIQRWRKNRELLHKEICKKGFNKKMNAFTQSYGSTTLDASCLRIGLVGFLPMDDPRIVGTIDAIGKKLSRGGLIERYDTKASPDGLPPGEGVFLACTAWMVACLWHTGRKAKAEALYEKLLALRNDVGLLAEEYDPQTGRQLGNFPQALSHIALTFAAYAMSGQWTPGSAIAQQR